MQLKKCLTITTVIYSVSLVILLAAYFIPGLAGLITGCVGLAAFGTATVIKTVNYRCSHCGELLPMIGKLPEYCKMCGQYIKGTDVKKGADKK